MKIEVKQLINIYEQALLAKSDNVLVHLQLVELYYSQGDFQGACDTCKKVLNIQPDLAKTNATVKRVLFTQDKHIKFKQEKFKIIEVDTQSLVNYPNAINQIYLGELDGLLIREFLNPETALQVKNNFSKISYVHPPSSFGSFVHLHTLKEISKREGYTLKYLISDFWKAINKTFVGNLKDKLEETFNVISRLIPVAEIVAYHQDVLYIPASFKVLYSNKGGFGSHRDDEALEIFDDYDNLKRILDLKTVISYFIVIDKAEQGGELILYHLLREETPEELRHIPYLHPLRDAYLENFPQEVVDANVGDMVIFNSSKIWHRVLKIQGRNNRITVGGFLAKSKNENRIFYFG
ncbi:2OG-Fe(II)-dependent halogenase WelO5 family protein [Nostoc sp.]|uniref:2OG-Fe(II)-dependent halogenase WelO5 family protein n=1 Tax=Nostoc sp. TaxID=1180 RepID=UPI002FF82406